MTGRTTPDQWLDRVSDGIRRARAADDLESALRVLTRLAHDALGDTDAAQREGALLSGERDYRVSGVFAISPDRAYNVLMANVGFPVEQRRLSIPIDWAHPGGVVRTEKPLLLENTDDHTEFKQFLKTSRMGSSIYMPIITQRGMVGQIVAAAQARWTFAPEDLTPMRMLASVAALIWQARDGDAWLAADYPAADAWYADRQGVEAT